VQPLAAQAHPRLAALIESARARAAAPGAGDCVVGIVHPCDALALDAAQRIAASGFATPLLIGDAGAIVAAARDAGVDLAGFEIEAAPGDARAAAQRAVELVHAGRVQALMKGSLHTDELMGAIVARANGMRTHTRVSHAFVFDLPRYHKLIALADCVINIAPHLPAKSDILTNALGLLRALGIANPKVGIVAAVETVNPAIPATVDAQALVDEAKAGAWPGAIVEGPFGFDNAISAEAARIKRMGSRVSGDADLLLMPDLNAGNMLYKSFNYIGGGDCAGLVLGAKVPVVLTSRADSALSRIASVALARLVAAHRDA
jgi:phosphate acetyltransferase/phosphate butyryltransferase